MGDTAMSDKPNKQSSTPLADLWNSLTPAEQQRILKQIAPPKPELKFEPGFFDTSQQFTSIRFDLDRWGGDEGYYGTIRAIGCRV